MKTIILDNTFITPFLNTGLENTESIDTG